MCRWQLRVDSRFARYLIALVLGLAAPAAGHLFPWPGPMPLMVYAPLVVAGAIFGGLGPGLLAVTLCVLQALYCDIEPLRSFTLPDAADRERLAGLFLTGAVASVLSECARRSAEQLTQAHRKMNTMLESIVDGFVAFDRQWRCTYANAAALRMLDKSREDLRGKDLWEMWPLAAASVSGATYRRAAAENIPLQVEDFYGEPLNAWFNVRCYPSPEGLSLFFTDITERRRTRERLRLLESAVLRISDGVVIVKIGGEDRCRPEPVFANPAFQNMTGFGLDDLQTEGCDFLLGSQPDPHFAGPPRAGDPLKCPSSLEGRVHRKDGSEFWAELSLRPLAAADGKYTHCVWTCRDITARKNAAAESRLLSSIVECSDDAILSKDLNGIVLSWNNGAEKIYGYSAKEMVGQPVTRLSLRGHEDEMAEILEYLKVGHKIDHLETERRRKDGQAIFVALTVSPLRDDAGEIVGASAISRDITDRKLAEKALRRSELRYRSLVNVVSQIVWTTDPKGEVVEDMPAWREFTGKSFEEIQGDRWLESLHPDDRARTMDIWLRAVETRSFYATNYRMRRLDGEYRWMAVHGVPVLDERGEVQEWVGSCADIHDRVMAEEEVRQLNLSLEKRVVERTAELQAANKELESFAYSVSHDLRAPLRAVDGFSRILLEEYAPQLPEDAQRFLNLVRKNAVQMGNLIDGLLAFSRLGRQILNKQAVAPAQLVQQVLADLAAEKEGRQIEIAVGDLPDCQGDPLLLKQVFFNLLSNALKYTRRCSIARIQVGSMAPEAGDRAVSHGKSTVYYVRDNGAGFDMRYADKLFGVFQRLHRVEDYEGTGVGLATVSRIVTRHGGRVWAEAAPEQGATFYFTLSATSTGDAVAARRDGSVLDLVVGLSEPAPRQQPEGYPKGS